MVEHKRTNARVRGSVRPDVEPRRMAQPLDSTSACTVLRSRSTLPGISTYTLNQKFETWNVSAVTGMRIRLVQRVLHAIINL